MGKQNPRVALTVPKDLNDTLQRLADLQDVPKTRIILDLLIEQKPVLDAIVEALEKIHTDKANALNIAKEFAQNMLLDANSKLGDISKEVKDL